MKAVGEGWVFAWRGVAVVVVVGLGDIFVLWLGGGGDCLAVISARVNREGCLCRGGNRYSVAWPGQEVSGSASREFEILVDFFAICSADLGFRIFLVWDKWWRLKVGH